MDNITNENEKLCKMVSVRFTEAQYKQIQEIAKSRNRKEADFIRLAVLNQIELLKKNENF